MLKIEEQVFTRGKLLVAKEWGDGFCLSCGERITSVEETKVTECPECGEVAVLSGEALLQLSERLAGCRSPYSNSTY